MTNKIPNNFNSSNQWRELPLIMKISKYLIINLKLCKNLIITKEYLEYFT